MVQYMNSLSELQLFSDDFIDSLPNEKDSATLVGLKGDLGSGKTAFVKAVAKKLGITEEVLSPTFVLAKFYAINNGLWGKLVHIDAYRIEKPEEAKVLRLEEILADSRNLVMIEWPEQLGLVFPEGARMLYFRFIDESTREIQY